MGERFAPGRCSYRAGSVADGSRAEARRRRGGREGMGEGFAPGRCSYRAGSVANGSRAEALRTRETHSWRPFTQRVIPVFITSWPKLSR